MTKIGQDRSWPGPRNGLVCVYDRTLMVNDLKGNPRCPKCLRGYEGRNTLMEVQ